MDPLDTHLDAGERILLSTRQHPVVFGGTVFFSVFAIGVVALIVGRNELADRSIALLWLAGALVVAIAWVSPIIRWRRSRFVVTTRRLLVTAGMARVRAIAMSAGGGPIEVRHTVWGRWLGYGSLCFVGDDGATHVFPRVAQADELREAVRRQASASSGVRAR